MSDIKRPHLVCFDTETTGLVSYYESLIEISAVRFNLKGEIIDKFTSLLDPMKEITQIITDITGITNDDLKGAPPFWEVLEGFTNFLEEDDILFAHNASFDANFVGLWLSKIMDILPPNRIYNTIDMARHMFPGFRSYKLAELIKNLELEGENAHRAEADVMATISLIRKCFEKAKVGEERAKAFLSKYYRHYTFGQYCIKPIESKDSKSKVIYSALRGKKNLKIKYNYSPPDEVDHKIYEDIDLQPLSLFRYKNETYLEGFSDDETYFRRIDLKRIEDAKLVQRKKDFVKPIVKKNPNLRN
jgi:DNA polymerase III epsilon subunit family exonuclease